MDPHLLDLIYDGIASGSCPIADDNDLRELLAGLEELARKDAMTNQQPPTPPHAPPPEPTPEPITVPPTDAPRPPTPVVKPTPTRRRA